MKKILLLLALASIALYSCRKETPIAGSGVELRFSTDTVFLDTVFRSVGSSTYNLKVFNPTDESVIIDDIRLGRNQSSKYRINVDGQPGNNHKGVEILPKDSIYIFIEVTLTELGSFPGLLYTDSILFNNKGTEQNVKLVTLARDAYFHYPTDFLVISDVVIPYSMVTNNPPLLWDKPHVFYGYGIIDEAIDIPTGAELYFHNNSGLLVLEDGQLTVGQTMGAGDSVTFTGDRLEPFYEDVPGQWGGVLGGIYFAQGSTGNRINNTVIKNATTAIRLDSVGDLDDQLTISNSYILNSSRVGIYGGYGNVIGLNTVVANSGLHLLYAFGGNYEFIHCTFANFWNQATRNTAGVTLTNYLDIQNEDNSTTRIVRDLNSASFGNCMVVGNNRQELAILKDNQGMLNYEFRSAILDVDESVSPADRSFDWNDDQFFKNKILINADPDFVNTDRNQYRLDSLSQAVNQGNVFDGSDVRLNAQDIRGNSRSNGIPDLGAFERTY
jgi:hypothetical protein